MSDRPRKYACILINIPPVTSKAIYEVQKKIDQKDLFVEEANDGLEDHHHVTVLYGLDDRYKNLVLRALKAIRPFAMQFGDITSFETSPKHDVLKFDIVDCPTLHQIHESIKTIFPNDYKYDEFRPHATLSYLNKGKAKNYIGMPNNITGRTIIVKHIVWSDTDSNKTLITLDCI